MKKLFLILYALICMCVLGCQPLSDDNLDENIEERQETVENIESETDDAVDNFESEYDEEELTVNPAKELENDTSYSNPIDAYFLPIIKNGGYGSSGLREYEVSSVQDAYRGVWKSEFDNIIKWLDNRFVYPEDKDAVAEYVKSVEQLIAATWELEKIAYFTPEAREQDQLELGYCGNVSGNGFRSHLNQVAAEIYRSAAMAIISEIEVFHNDRYTFLEVDYASEHYE